METTERHQKNFSFQTVAESTDNDNDSEQLVTERIETVVMLWLHTGG